MPRRKKKGRLQMERLFKKGRGKGINQDRNSPLKPMKMSYADRNGWEY